MWTLLQIMNPKSNSNTPEIEKDNLILWSVHEQLALSKISNPSIMFYSYTLHYKNKQDISYK